jgi:16S rRNA (cytosine967-C5)-methyltransferase
MNVFSLAAFREGLFEVQDEASQLAALVVAPPPGGLVADVCAGAGGKTLALSALMRNKGRILALDVSPSRLQELVRRGRRAGVSNARSVRTPHGAFPPEVESLRGKFVRVLADVPCSGFGALRRNPEARWNTTPEDLLRFPPLQEALARRALGLLAPNGRLVYATCTLFREENEGVVERLLASVPGLELVRVVEILGKAMAEPLCDPTGTYLRLLPHVHGCDGFFCAVLRVK